MTVKLKHLREAFKGNEDLEKILENKESVDWRMMVLDDVFILHDEDDDEGRDPESMEDDPELTFRVPELQLLGLLYCKCEPKIRIRKFYEFF